MRKLDAWGNPILQVGDIVNTEGIPNDPGTIVKILQVNANGAHLVAVKWFVWDGGRTTQERVQGLELVSKAQ